MVAHSLASIRTVFFLDVSPFVMLSDAFGTFKVRLRKAKTAWFA